MKWHFSEQTSSVNRDPVEAQFFDEAESESGETRTDALVRETIQNALDASRGDEPVRVRFAVHESTERPAWVADYSLELDEHLAAPKVELDLGEEDHRFRWLVYEDFGTHGLRGDVARVDDPEEGDRWQQLYWFWRNVGRSGKSGEDLGRWGLGKTVLPAAGRANAMLGLTVRSDDPGRAMLMGQCVLPIHKLGGVSFQPEGFLSNRLEKVGRRRVPMPIEDPDVIGGFEEHWQTSRGAASGLSVVVPYLREGVEAAELLLSATLHWFVSIVRGRLIVEVTDEHGTVTRLDALTIEAEARRMSWTGTKKDRRHRPPPIAFTRWAVNQPNPPAFESELAGVGKVPSWNEELFEPSTLAALRVAFAAKARIALRVHLQLETARGGPVETYFDVFFERDADAKGGEDDFVRDGMSISGMHTLQKARGTRGLLLVDHEPLSALLGDTEGPAHVEWKTTNKRPDRRFSKWARRVTFVRNGLKELAALLETPPEGLETNLLADLFGLDDVRPDAPGGRRRKPGGGAPPLSRRFSQDLLSGSECLRTHEVSTSGEIWRLRSRIGRPCVSQSPTRVRARTQSRGTTLSTSIFAAAAQPI